MKLHLSVILMMFASIVLANEGVQDDFSDEVKDAIKQIQDEATNKMTDME